MATTTMLVTGGAGFIGSHLVDRLLADGHRVIVVDDLSSGSRDRVAAAATLEVTSIVDQDPFATIVDLAQPSVIFHLAAQSSVTVSVKDPLQDCDVNVRGTLNVVEAARRCRAAVVFTSTGGALYGNQAPIPTSEDCPPSPVSPYGASKWAGEAYVRTWGAAHRMSHAVCRLGNVYGPRQSPHGEAGVVSILSHLLLHDRPATLFGYGRATRDYVHVVDVTDALVRAAGVAGVFNVATGCETPVSAIYDRLRIAASKDLEPVLAPLRVGELERSCMDPTRASKTLAWFPHVGLEEGLSSTYAELVAEWAQKPIIGSPGG